MQWHHCQLEIIHAMVIASSQHFVFWSKGYYIILLPLSGGWEGFFHATKPERHPATNASRLVKTWQAPPTWHGWPKKGGKGLPIMGQRLFSGYRWSKKHYCPSKCWESTQKQKGSGYVCWSLFTSNTIYFPITTHTFFFHFSQYNQRSHEQTKGVETLSTLLFVFQIKDLLASNFVYNALGFLKYTMKRFSLQHAFCFLNKRLIGLKIC